MVGFKNRYLIMGVFLDPNKEFSVDEPIRITSKNLWEAIVKSILVNFGECGLASATNSSKVKYVNPTTKHVIVRTSREDYQKVWAAITMIKSVGHCAVVFNLLDLISKSYLFVFFKYQPAFCSGSIKACKTAALKLEELKFEQYKLSAGDRLTADAHKEMQNCLATLELLEH
ncbi:hypothetical protein SASPL_114500 [Salvia splendens]|uniref:Uncharacterized protein n=1 Tax=Salvia splendens TaxID=180675 RepID=A0A8X8Y1F3_SALSN|nr:probable ribonuclease P/MRP protein subunit POP5 [Salvia splendens]XP_042058678.1 probable ribonuclease P/MRP protein subunit POP5 [Salvia splendens]KAG6424088.1 hypothetical protein SASPL_114500 [Salvia splendens]